MNIMSNSIQTFDFNSNQVRIQIINSQEYFCAKDVCSILQIVNNRQAVKKLSREDVILNDTHTNGGIQKMSFVNEAGLYGLIFQSRTQEAQSFRKWVFNDILPEIRKTGKFEAQQPKIDSQFLLQISQEMAKKEALIEGQGIIINNLELEIDKHEAENRKLKESIQDFFKDAELFTRRQVCNFLVRQSVVVKEQDITDFLNKKKWLCKGIYNKNKATAEACRVGWFINDISVKKINGQKKTIEYGKFTTDGLVKMYEYFKNKS